MVTRFSSRRAPLDASFLNRRLAGAKRYDRIAGYFSSSILEVAGEALESVEGVIRVVCNSELSKRDVEVAKLAQATMRREWCGSRPEHLGDPARPRFKRLHDLLVSRKLQVRVLPDDVFGMIHGKAGVVTFADGRRTCFLGSANESRRAFLLNYELIWEDDSLEAVAWVQEEFDALWSSPFAVELADFVVRDLKRLAEREVVRDVEDWTEDPDPASVVVEAPVMRRETGLWEHQKHFVKLAFDAHRGPHGARFVLADQVGLGKTLQLAMAAQLMALTGDRPVLILAPKPLVQQWQDELHAMLDLPAAIWMRGRWVDERGIDYPADGAEAIQHCPRRIGIVSTGLITQQSAAAEFLSGMKFECLILDEAHRARRRHSRTRRTVKPNNLLKFIRRISPQTRSLLLATATPVQIDPIEAFDLLDALARGSDAVLGSHGSRWRKAEHSLNLLLGREPPPTDFHEQWDWLRNPFPPSSEGTDFNILRRSLSLRDGDAYAPGRAVDRLRAPDRQRIRDGFSRFAEHHNPYIRTIILRTRELLENSIDPETGEPFLAPVKVRLHGEAREDAVNLPPYLEDAYRLAEEFCVLLAKRANTGFFRTMLLRRMGSTMEAGRLTVARILDGWNDIDETEDSEQVEGRLQDLTAPERRTLTRLSRAMEANRERDPKCALVLRLLTRNGWLRHGCIVFSQYYDSVRWLADHLSGELPDEPIGIYAGANRSGVLRAGSFARRDREALKEDVWAGELRLLLGTDAAAEGLNLQRLGTLINLDLPWNPSRLEQRKGRIQRIGQARSEVDIYNMRYAGSVEDRVHELLSGRLEDISRLFGQLPDTLEDAWVQLALGDAEAARQTIDAVPSRHPFELRHHEVKPVDWESCARVLDDEARTEALARGWRQRGET
ncbi:MAG: phospholipase D-like domain-containing protein [Rhodospirillaceae bacterium]|nr:phospholipase D-like domain-containing protein [Rhodospirillaceae bacterium]